MAEVEAFGEGDDLAVGVVCDGIKEFAVVFGVAVGVVVAVVVAPFVDVVAVPPEAVCRSEFSLDAVLAGAEVAVAVFLRVDQGGGDPVSVAGDFFLDVFRDGAVDADAYVPFALTEAFEGAFDFVEAVSGFEGAVGVPFGVVEVVGGEQSGAVGEVVEADGAGLVVFFDGGASGVGGGAVVHAEFVGAGVLPFRGGGIDHGLSLDHVALFDGLHVFAVAISQRVSDVWAGRIEAALVVGGRFDLAGLQGDVDVRNVVDGLKAGVDDIADDGSVLPCRHGFPDDGVRGAAARCTGDEDVFRPVVFGICAGGGFRLPVFFSVRWADGGFLLFVVEFE